MKKANAILILIFLLGACTKQPASTANRTFTCSCSYTTNASYTPIITSFQYAGIDSLQAVTKCQQETTQLNIEYNNGYCSL